MGKSINTHLAFSELEISLVKESVKNWQRKGFIGEICFANSETGTVDVVTDDWTVDNTRKVTLRLNKLFNGKGVFGTKKRWVTELITTEIDGSVAKRGCVKGATVMYALENAVEHVSYHYPNSTTIQTHYFI